MPCQNLRGKGTNNFDFGPVEPYQANSDCDVFIWCINPEPENKVPVKNAVLFSTLLAWKGLRNKQSLFWSVVMFSFGVLPLKQGSCEKCQGWNK